MGRRIEDEELTIPLRIKLPRRMISLHPHVLHALFLLGRGPFFGDFEHALDGVDEEDGDESENMAN